MAKKENITQKDALMFLIKYKPNILHYKIEKELPAYYRKNLDSAISEMAKEGLIRKIKFSLVHTQYKLTNDGKRFLNRRFAVLGEDNTTRDKLIDLVYAFGM